MSSSPPVGLRERKKAETRDALRAAARRLFETHGFRSTSIEQIAAEANVSERTFFRYFASKEDLLLPEIEDVLDALESALLDRPAGEAALDAYEAALMTVMGRGGRRGHFLQLAPGIDPTDPALAPRLFRALIAWEERLAGLFAARLRADPSGAVPEAERDLYCAVAAGVAIAATRTVVRTILARREGAPRPPADLVRRVFAITRSGCVPTPA